MLQTRTIEPDTLGLLKSLTYFADADEFSDPVVFDKKVSWDKIKTSISKTVNDYLT